jgi:hypothetical protein
MHLPIGGMDIPIAERAPEWLSVMLGVMPPNAHTLAGLYSLFHGLVVRRFRGPHYDIVTYEYDNRMHLKSPVYGVTPDDSNELKR